MGTAVSIASELINQGTQSRIASKSGSFARSIASARAKLATEGIGYLRPPPGFTCFTPAGRQPRAKIKRKPSAKIGERLLSGV